MTRGLLGLVGLGSVALTLALACGSSERSGFSESEPGNAEPNAGTFGEGGVGDGPPGACTTCSPDGKKITYCDGRVIQECPPDLRCGAGKCLAPCDAANANKSSVGCDYYAKAMLGMSASFGGCFVSFVANTFDKPVHIQASFGQKTIDVAKFAKIPKGAGKSVTYAPYDPVQGLAPNEVAILFLSNDPVPHGNWFPGNACPVPAAVGLESQSVTGVSIFTMKTQSFHITTDVPVVAYQMMPYGGGEAASTGATLLLPTSAWDKNYIAAAAYRAAMADIPIPPTTAIIASQDGTIVKMLPTVDVAQGNATPAGKKNVPFTFSLQAGEAVEFVQEQELTGSVVEANKPVAVIAGHMGLRVPFDGLWSDHAEQQIPPVRALGSEYVGVSYRDRFPGAKENRLWRIVSVAKGTQLVFDPPIPGAPSSMNAGEFREFNTDTPFVVKSQDKDHPFMVFTYMSGSGPLQAHGAPEGYGDADFVRLVPGLQFLRRYVFFTDPTYPETNLVVIRRKGDAGFKPVKLDCAGELSGWQAVGSGGVYEWTRIDLSRHDFQAQGVCNNGRHEMSSDESFGLYVWGWGSPETRAGLTPACQINAPGNSCDISYGYPAGENVSPINYVEVPAIPH